MTRAELLHEAGLYKAAFNYGRRKVRGASGGAWHYAKTTKKDTQAMLRAHRKLRSSSRYALLHQARTNILPGARGSLGVTIAQAKKSAATVARTTNINTLLKKSRNQAVRSSAVRLGAVTLGAGALYIGAKTYRMKKRQAQEHPQFSSYDVYPQLSHSAARQQIHNRPVYYDDRDVGGGPPRVEDMNMTREELIEMSVAALAKRSKSNIVGKYKEIGGVKGIPGTSKRNMARTFTSLDTKRKKRNKKRIASFDRAAKAATKGKYRKTYSSAIDRADRRSKIGHLAVGAATGGVSGAIVAGTGFMPYHRKSAKAMTRHVQGVKAVKKQMHKEKKRADSAKYFNKKYVPAWNKGHEKSPVVKGYRKMAKRIKRMGEEERNRLVDMVFEALLQG